MPEPQMGLRSTLVRAMAFSDHRAQEETARRRPGRTRQWQNTGNAVAESDNIVVETAEKIFADLADPQTVNNDKKDSWQAPLWQALSEAGFPLGWGPDDLGGSRAGPARGFSLLYAARRFAVAGSLAPTMLARWLLGHAENASP